MSLDDLPGVGIFAVGVLLAAALLLALYLLFRPWTGTPPVVVDPDDKLDSFGPP